MLYGLALLANRQARAGAAGRISTFYLAVKKRLLLWLEVGEWPTTGRIRERADELGSRILVRKSKVPR